MVQEMQKTAAKDGKKEDESEEEGDEPMQLLSGV
jgi:hypothetical protein